MKFEIIDDKKVDVDTLNGGDLFQDPRNKSCVYLVGEFWNRSEVIAMEIESGETYKITQFDKVIPLKPTIPLRLIIK